jgi:flagellar FliL protein
MVEQEEDQVEVVAPPAPRRKRRLPLLIGVVVVVVLAGIGGYVAFTQRAAQGGTHATKGEVAKVSRAELYLPLDPAFVVNFRDDDSLRFLQVGITLMAHDQAAIDTAKAAEPVLRDAMVSLLSSQDYTVIGSAAGRQKLQAQALAAARKVVQARLGRPGIDALYFTSFVMQ